MAGPLYAAPSGCGAVGCCCVCIVPLHTAPRNCGAEDASVLTYCGTRSLCNPLKLRRSSFRMEHNRMARCCSTTPSPSPTTPTMCTHSTQPWAARSCRQACRSNAVQQGWVQSGNLITCAKPVFATAARLLHVAVVASGGDARRLTAVEVAPGQSCLQAAKSSISTLQVFTTPCILLACLILSKRRAVDRECKGHLHCRVPGRGAGGPGRQQRAGKKGIYMQQPMAQGGWGKWQTSLSVTPLFSACIRATWHRQKWLSHVCPADQPSMQSLPCFAG